MPQVFKIGSYLVYFWINEGMPLEPIHVHVAEGVPNSNGTKIWITRKGGSFVGKQCFENSREKTANYYGNNRSKTSRDRKSLGKKIWCY